MIRWEENTYIQMIIPTIVIAVTMWRRVFLGWRTQPNKSTLVSTFSSWSTSSSGWADLCSSNLDLEIKLVSVHCCFGQVLVHVGALLLCRLLHHPTLFCIYIPGQNMDRYKNMNFNAFGCLCIIIFTTIYYLKLDIIKKLLSRTSVPTSIAADDSSGHPAVPQHPQDVDLHQVKPPICWTPPFLTLGPPARLWPWP